MSKPSESRRQVTRPSREEVAAWSHRMGPELQRDIVLDTAILGLLANWCPDCKHKHPLALHLEALLIALCDGDMGRVKEYVAAAHLFAEVMGGSLKDLFRENSPDTDLDELLRRNHIDLASSNQPNRQHNDD